MSAIQSTNAGEPFALSLSLDRREGTVKIGDRVLAINGINVSGASLQEAHSVMRQCRGTTLFLIEYDVAIVGKTE